METYLEKVCCFNIRDLQKMASSVSNLTETVVSQKSGMLDVSIFPKMGLTG